MRTTLTLEDDAIGAARAYARSHGISLGRAASELIRRGASYQLGTRKVDGIPVLDATGEFPLITSERVRDLMNES